MELRRREKRLELLMKQAELPAGLTDPYFLDGWIEQVETNRTNREWHIQIGKDTLVPAPIYRTFSLHIQEKMNHITKLRLLLNIQTRCCLTTS